ncbi:uncharacterized protein [Leptinotarsa decemlineata]|uniref:uncharacterized protein n=1 Tax=Leptinotarsa decemlineata TaxID=7539 RepID=UPI003D307B73
MGTTIEDLETWVDEMMKKREITSYKIDVAGSTSKGDGYLGEVNFLKVVASLNEENEKVYNIVVKSANKSEKFRKNTPIQEAYYREMFMYTKVFPIFEEFQREYAIETIFDKYAKCYSVCQTDKKEALVLNNLKTDGFSVHNRTIPQNLNHVLFVFRNYGRLHGISLAMKVKKPALFKSMTKNMTNVLGQFIVQANMASSFVDNFKNARMLFMKDGKEAIANKLEDVEKKVEVILTNMFSDDLKEAVVLHGDCWNNNMMFKYKTEEDLQPIDMRFIDFQLSRVASPILDLSYYLYTCADKTVLQYFDILIRAYHDSLSNFLKQFDMNVDDILPLDDLKDKWKTYGRFGLALAPFIIKVELCKSDEVVDIASSVEKGDLKDALKMGIKDQSEYERRVKDVLEHFAEKFL